MTQINLKSDVLAKDEQYVWHSMKPYNPQATYVVENLMVQKSQIQMVRNILMRWLGYGVSMLAMVVKN